MSLFSDDSSLGYQRQARKGRFAVALFGLVALVIVVIGLLPAPYVIQYPGPVYDTLGTVTIDEEEVPMISIPSGTTYPTEGELDMLTVSSRGNPDSQPLWFEVIAAWLDPTQKVVSMEQVYPADSSVDEVREQSALQMEASQQEAIAAAMSELEQPYTSRVSVHAVTAGMPAEGVLQESDVILTVNEETVGSTSQLQHLITANGSNTPAVLGIQRAGESLTVEVQPVASATSTGISTVIGVQVTTSYDFPIQVVIQLKDVGGPSAGMMFALGIVDKLTEGPLTDGKIIAGTGTIDAAGEVGPIGGIEQKLVSASRAGASYFLAPADNCPAVIGNIPSGLTVIAVETLSDARDALERISAGVAVSELPSCEG